MLKKLKHIGPGAMVAAAFIGPGTITTATLAGASYGYTLLWAILFSVLATIVLQEMASRLGVIGRKGLGEAIRAKLNGKLSFYLAATLVISAIFIGNAAYESGNISGAVLGFKSILGEDSYFFHFLPLIIGGLAAVLLISGRYNYIEKTLIFLVATIGLVFLISAFWLSPDWGSVFKGLFIPSFPKGSAIVIVGLIGTTVVPYNLFLHASSSKQKWKTAEDYSRSRLDTTLSILFGGLITMSILITASAVLNATGNTEITPGNLGAQLKPFMGSFADWFIAFGFLAAGLSSAITAPLAAAYAVSELLNWKEDLKSIRFRISWGIIVFFGILFSSIPSWKPTVVILFAQTTNGILLPIIAGFLLWVSNDKKILGESTNSILNNILGLLIILVTLLLGAKGIANAFGWL